MDRIVLHQAMADLPRQVRAVMALHYFADLTVPEIAEATGERENTIKSQLRDGRERLRRALGAQSHSGLRGGE